MDAISRLRWWKIYIEPIENPKTAALRNTAEVVANKIQTLSTDRLHAEQKKETNYRNLAAQSHCKNSFNLDMISVDGLPQKQQYIHGLKHDVVIALCSTVPTIFHVFHNLKGCEGTIFTFEAVRRFYL